MCVYVYICMMLTLSLSLSLSLFLSPSLPPSLSLSLPPSLSLSPFSEKGHKSASIYLFQARQATKNFMFGIATKYTNSGMRNAENSFAHHLKLDLQALGKQIETLTESTIREGERQLQLALRHLGDLHIRSGNRELGAASLRDLLRRPGPAPQEFLHASIAGSGDVWAAHAALQQARFLFGASGDMEMLAKVYHVFSH